MTSNEELARLEAEWNRTRPRTRQEITGLTSQRLLALVESGDPRYPSLFAGDYRDDPSTGLTYGRADQLYRSDLSTMKPEQIEAARLAGQLDDVQAGKVRPPDLGGDAA